MIEGLETELRLILEARLSPAIGSAFQPTGFPDLGAAEFERPRLDGTSERALLVESVQSLANHLEGVCWDDAERQPVPTLARLPYIEVSDVEGRFLTSSRLEPHRLAGAYVKNATLDGQAIGEWMIDRLAVEEGVPLDWRSIYAGLFQLDPLCLLHGVFFSDPQWRRFGNPKVRRAITAVIEAHDAQPVVSGGVKRDDVNPTARESRAAREGFGFVPFGRTEYTAAEIVMSVAVDLEQIRGYGLGDDATDLLVAVALWEIRTLLDRPLRLRTACDLVVDDVRARRPDGWELPSADVLAQRIEGSSVTFDTSEPLAGLIG